MRLITVQLPPDYVDGLDQLISDGIFRCRTDTIRVAIRDLLIHELSSLNTNHRSNKENHDIPL